MGCEEQRGAGQVWAGWWGAATWVQRGVTLPATSRYALPGPLELVLNLLSTVESKFLDKAVEHLALASAPLCVKASGDPRRWKQVESRRSCLFAKCIARFEEGACH